MSLWHRQPCHHGSCAITFPTNSGSISEVLWILCHMGSSTPAHRLVSFGFCLVVLHYPNFWELHLGPRGGHPCILVSAFFHLTVCPFFKSKVILQIHDVWNWVQGFKGMCNSALPSGQDHGVILWGPYVLSSELCFIPVCQVKVCDRALELCHGWLFFAPFTIHFMPECLIYLSRFWLSIVLNWFFDGFLHTWPICKCLHSPGGRGKTCVAEY